ncbi:hypothetical protein HAX54_033497, partial [Datura stramonium]|nr:hypothetical protein [Datura stramonium]
LFGLEIPICLLLSLVALLGGCSSLLSDSNSAGGSFEASVNQPPLISELHPTLLDDDTPRAKLADALVERDYSVESFLAKRHHIRGFVFFPKGEALSERNYALHQKEILQLGTVQSRPFRRVESAIKEYYLLLERA